MLVKHRMKYEFQKNRRLVVYLCEDCDWHFSPGNMKFSGANDRAHRVLPNGFVARGKRRSAWMQMP